MSDFEAILEDRRQALERHSNVRIVIRCHYRHTIVRTCLLRELSFSWDRRIQSFESETKKVFEKYNREYLADMESLRREL